MEELLRDEIAAVIRREFTDGKSPYLTFTGVEVSKDLSSAKVYVSFLEDSYADSWLGRLEKAAGFIRSELNKVIRLKKIPRLYFKRDNSIARAFQLEETLARIRSDEENSSEDSE